MAVRGIGYIMGMRKEGGMEVNFAKENEGMRKRMRTKSSEL